MINAPNKPGPSIFPQNHTKNQNHTSKPSKTTKKDTKNKNPTSKPLFVPPKQPKRTPKTKTPHQNPYVSTNHKKGHQKPKPHIKSLLFHQNQAHQKRFHFSSIARCKAPALGIVGLDLCKVPGEGLEALGRLRLRRIGPERLRLWFKQMCPKWHLGKWKQRLNRTCGLPRLFNFEPRPIPIWICFFMERPLVDIMFVGICAQQYGKLNSI